MAGSTDFGRRARLRAFEGGVAPALDPPRDEPGIALRRATKPRRYQQVVDELQRLIQEGEIRPGDFLLPERQLAERLGVSRTTVREGITALATRGIVAFAPNGGAYVREAGLSDYVTPLLSSALFLEEGVAHLMEVRKVLEAEAARLAATRADPLQLRAIEEAVDRMERDTEAGGPGDQADQDFHLRVAEASQNPLLAQVMTAIFAVLGEMYTESRHRLTADRERSAQFVAHHRDVCAALRARDPEQARTAMYVHLAATERELALD